MAQSLQYKQEQFLVALSGVMVAFIAARNQLKTLAEEYNSNSDISGITQPIIDQAVTDGYKVGFMTPTYIADMMTVAQPHLEAILAGSGVAAGAPDLIHFLRLTPS